MSETLQGVRVDFHRLRRGKFDGRQSQFDKVYVYRSLIKRNTLSKGEESILMENMLRKLNVPLAIPIQASQRCGNLPGKYVWDTLSALSVGLELIKVLFKLVEFG